MTPPDKRPILHITFSLILVLYHITGALQVLQLPENIRVLTSIPPMLQVILHVVWASVFMISAGAMLLHRQSQTFRRRAMQFNQGVWTLFILYSVGRLWLFAQADYDSQRFPLLILLAALILTRSMIKAATFVWRHINEKRGYFLW